MDAMARLQFGRPSEAWKGGASDFTPRLKLRKPYFGTVRGEDTVERNGFTMTFKGWTYTLEHYALALEDAGFRIEALREPRPTGATETFKGWQEIPLFLQIRTVKS